MAQVFHVKALSLKQPFAELVICGKKTIELRKWNTKFRGEFFIHASKTNDKKAMIKFGYDKLPTGCIVGKATLENVKNYENESQHKADKDKHLADSTWGKYGFVLTNAIRIKEIPVKGKLNFWEFY